MMTTIRNRHRRDDHRRQLHVVRLGNAAVTLPYEGLSRPSRTAASRPAARYAATRDALPYSTRRRGGELPSGAQKCRRALGVRKIPPFATGPLTSRHGEGHVIRRLNHSLGYGAEGRGHGRRPAALGALLPPAGRPGPPEAAGR